MSCAKVRARVDKIVQAKSMDGLDVEFLRLALGQAVSRGEKKELQPLIEKVKAGEVKLVDLNKDAFLEDPIVAVSDGKPSRAGHVAKLAATMGLSTTAVFLMLVAGEIALPGAGGLVIGWALVAAATGTAGGVGLGLTETADSVD